MEEEQTTTTTFESDGDDTYATEMINDSYNS